MERGGEQLLCTTMIIFLLTVVGTCFVRCGQKLLGERLRVVFTVQHSIVYVDSTCSQYWCHITKKILIPK